MTLLDPDHREGPTMRIEILDNDDGAKRRRAYRRERDMLAHATIAHLVGLLDADDELRRTAARDELIRRNEPVGT